MPNTVFDKTVQGREEIATRAAHLAPRLRTLLLLVDGKRDAAELMAKVGGLGLDEKALVELLEGGFIELAAPDITSATAMAPTTPDVASVVPGSVAREGRAAPAISDDPIDLPAASGFDAQSTLAGSASVPINDPAMPTGAAVQGVLREGETQFQALYNFFNETIRSAIGLRGYGMQLKVERAVSIDDFRALRQPYLDAVLKAKGPELEHSLRNRLDQLLSLGN